MRWLLGIVLCSVVASTAFAGEPDWWRDGGPRIRTQDQRTTNLLREGVARSATLRALVDRVEAGDIIVYVNMSPLMQRTLAGRLTWMTRVAGFRYLRVTISTDLTSDQIIAVLAHELQHVIEVAEDSGVVDEPSLAALYKRIGHPSRAVASSGWETEAAQDTGKRVRHELTTAPAAATVASRLSDRDKV